MSTMHELSDAEVIDLEPTMDLELTGSHPGASAAPRSGAGVALVEGSVASLTGETNNLLRSRLLAAAVFLAAAYGLLFVWVFLSDNPGTLTAEGSRYSVRAGLIALRCVLAVVAAGVLASEVPLSLKQLRVTEYVLFLGLTLLFMVSQYTVNLDLLRRGTEYVPITLAHVKDAVIQMVALMMIYGMLIPNRPAVAARVLLAMFVGPVIAVSLVGLYSEVAPVVGQLRAAEEAGTNILFLAIGAALAVYGSFVVNGMRSELHRVRKFGHYRLIRKLGTGGMGEVYLAEHALLKRPCALKLIKPEASADPVALARFEREVQSSARLAHHSTIKIYDYGHTDDGTFYYVMEHLEGMSLAEMVRLYGPLPAGRVIYVFRQVCAGLAEAHKLGLVHRDLKPANVFLAVLGGETDVAKVLDFGLVKPTLDPGAVALTADLTVSGTPLFMSPEQAMGDRSLDPRADIYGLGAVMYDALTGRPPFLGDNAFAVMMAHSRDPVVPPSEVRPGVPHDLEAVVLRCLAKKPEDRYVSVRALSDALAACPSAGTWGPGRSDAWWASIGMAEVEARPVEAQA